MSRLRDLFGDRKVLIGMIHLPPLPDYPESPGIDRIVDYAVRDALTLEAAGFGGVLLENEYDRPHKVSASPETVVAMTRATGAVVAATRDIIVGCEILLNDPAASLDVAKSAGASFIRTDYFVDRMTRPEYGEFDIDPEGLLAHRERIGASEVLILADIQVKYATMIEPRAAGESARLAAEKGADSVVVTGDASGEPPGSDLLKEAAQGLPVLIGSGLAAGNACALLGACDGAIVGTSLMTDRRVDPRKASALMAALE